MAAVTNDHDHPKTIHPRFDRRVLLASAAGLGLSAAVGPVGEAWAKGGKGKKKKPKPIMTKEEQAICDAGLAQWSAYRRQITVGPSDKKEERSPLQEFVIDPEYSKYVRMHIDFMFSNFTLQGLRDANPHKGGVYVDEGGNETFHYSPPASSSKLKQVYWGQRTNWVLDLPVRPQRLRNPVSRWLHDVSHGRLMIVGRTVLEAKAASPCGVGYVVRLATTKDGQRAWQAILAMKGIVEAPQGRESEPAITPEGTKSFRVGRSYEQSEMTPPVTLRGNEGRPILAKFRRHSEGDFLSFRLLLHRVKGRREKAVPGRSGVHLDTIYLVPTGALEKSAQYRIRLHAKIQRNYAGGSKSPVTERTWTREFWTGKNDFGP